VKKRWTAVVYAFYHSDPVLETENGRQYILFTCFGKGCKQTVRRYIGTADESSTRNLRSHVKACWGEDILQRAELAKVASVALETVVKPYKLNGTLTSAFAFKGTGKPVYSTQPLTKTQTKTETVRWICEDFRPMAIVKDRGFNKLMKSGRPAQYVPSPSTVSRDVKQVFVKTRARIARKLQSIDSRVSLQMDCWTSPNH
ncbi:hypothetical protein BDN72DRAFT_742281, partial [Pluteus cervinus]